jgi:hypothetical protein
MDVYVSGALKTHAIRTTASLLNLLCGAGNFAKIWCECEQHEILYIE